MRRKMFAFRRRTRAIMDGHGYVHNILQSPSCLQARRVKRKWRTIQSLPNSLRLTSIADPASNPQPRVCEYPGKSHRFGGFSFPSFFLSVCLNADVLSPQNRDS